MEYIFLFAVVFLVSLQNVLKKQYNYIWVQVIPARSNISGHIGITSCINIVNHEDAEYKINNISELEGVSFAVESI